MGWQGLSGTPGGSLLTIRTWGVGAVLTRGTVNRDASCNREVSGNTDVSCFPLFSLVSFFMRLSPVRCRHPGFEPYYSTKVTEQSRFEFGCKNYRLSCACRRFCSCEQTYSRHHKDFGPSRSGNCSAQSKRTRIFSISLTKVGSPVQGVLHFDPPSRGRGKRSF